MTIIIRRIFPTVTQCPVCKGTKYRPAGKSRAGSLIYRRCAYCGDVYRVPPIAEERDDGGAWSRIVLIG